MLRIEIIYWQSSWQPGSGIGWTDGAANSMDGYKIGDWAISWQWKWEMRWMVENSANQEGGKQSNQNSSKAKKWVTERVAKWMHG